VKIASARRRIASSLAVNAPHFRARSVRGALRPMLILASIQSRRARMERFAFYSGGQDYLALLFASRLISLIASIIRPVRHISMALHWQVM
jgi:hypothetical protein